MTTVVAVLLRATDSAARALEAIPFKHSLTAVDIAAAVAGALWSRRHLRLWFLDDDPPRVGGATPLFVEAIHEAHILCGYEGVTRDAYSIVVDAFDDSSISDPTVWDECFPIRWPWPWVRYETPLPPVEKVRRIADQAVRRQARIERGSS